MPTLARPPLPVMAPEKTVLALLPPVVSVADPSAAVPAPLSEPKVASKLLRSMVAPAAMLTAPGVPNAVALPAISRPPYTSIAPVKALLPPRVTSLLPSLAMPPVPEMLPLKANASLRLNASVPLLTTSPRIAPVVPPLPSCRVPALIVVPPV